MEKLYSCGITLGLLLLICMTFQSVCCHDDIRNDLDKLEKNVSDIENTQTYIKQDMEALRTTLLNDMKKAGLLETTTTPPTSQSEPESPAIDENAIIDARLKRLEHLVNALEHYVYIETVEGKDRLRSLRGAAGEEFDGNMVEVERLSKEMIEEVDQTLACVREELRDTENTANTRNKIVGNLQYYQGIASSCHEWYDSCSVPDSECRDEKCQCAPGLSYDSLRQKCVDKCSYSYGDTYQVVHNYIIRGFNQLSLNETSLDECKQLCKNEINFTCRSFDYFPDHQNCYLSDVTKLEAEDGWEYNGLGVHFQRDCAYDKY